tara:strand:- start:4 stop:399 length:396 start_codon:yes stop_codon:yes gene_type:complete
MNIKNILNNQYSKFLIVGISTVIIDYIFYQIFLLFFTIDGSKILSFAIGTVYSFKMNKSFTFQIKNSNINFFFKFLLIYLIGLYINVIINKFALFFFNNLVNYKFQLAFFIATICSAFFNFLGMKLFVFKK